jgi:hypothetical protein
MLVVDGVTLTVGLGVGLGVWLGGITVGVFTGGAGVGEGRDIRVRVAGIAPGRLQPARKVARSAIEIKMDGVSNFFVLWLLGIEKYLLVWLNDLRMIA